MLLALLVVWVLCFAYCSSRLNKNEIWFSNLDQDSAILFDALLVNSGNEPTYLDHPGLGAFYLYGKMQQVFSYLGLSAIADFPALAYSRDPLALLPDMFYKARAMSIIVCIVTALLFGFAFYLLSARLAAGVLASCLFLGSGGVLFQSLVVRTELSAAFLGMMAFFFLCIYARKINRLCDGLFLALAGIALGFSVLTKIQAIPFLVLAFPLVGWIASRNVEQRTSDRVLLSRLFFAGIFLCCLLFWAYFRACFGGRTPPPALVALLALIAATSLSLAAPRWLSPKVEAAAESFVLLALGILTAFPLAFVLCSVHAAPTRAKLLEMIFSLRFPDYKTSLSKGFVTNVVGKQLIEFLSYYSLRSLQLPVLVLAMIFARKKARTAAIIVLSGGLLMCVVSSLRYYSVAYLMFSDCFFDAAIVIAAVGLGNPGGRRYGVLGSRTAQPERRESEALSGDRFRESQSRETGERSRGWHIERPAMIVAWCVVAAIAIAIRNCGYVRQSYAAYNSGLRDRIDLVPYGVSTSVSYHTMLVSKYGSTGNVLAKLFEDPALNGTNDGIVLSNKVNVGQSYVAAGGRGRSQEIQKLGVDGQPTEGAWISRGEEAFDFVGPLETIGPDGKADAVVWLRIGTSCGIRAVEVRCGASGVWTTVPHTGAWALGVADKTEPTVLLNRSDGSVSIEVNDRRELLLYLCDNGVLGREEGLDSVVVAVLGDGSRRFFPIMRLR